MKYFVSITAKSQRDRSQIKHYCIIETDEPWRANLAAYRDVLDKTPDLDPDCYNWNVDYAHPMEGREASRPSHWMMTNLKAAAAYLDDQINPLGAIATALYDNMHQEFCDKT